MVLRLWVRNHITDRVNAPIRRQLASLIPSGARVVEVGCANGRLLLDVGWRVDCALGIDRDAPMIDAAIRSARRRNLPHLEFIAADARNLTQWLRFRPDLAVASLSLHEMPPRTAVAVLRQLALADTVLIADLVEPESGLQRALLHADEWIAGHLDRYRAYQAQGGMPALLEAGGLAVRQMLPTRNPAVRIWVCAPHVH
ncbi:class I SAM-dependent methyltransferase [Aquisalimonas sp.]|uniref:class I SAM-dependent methyltransferase n=1 Tax=Aquisalimonas sp. TaxID=1872621 RepID=UPI0025BB48D7|nr:class I SAM-dependent methyltransferase [Aquisalimonas sp.]